MRYPYECKSCNHEKMVSKPMSERDSDEYCENCGSLMVRKMSTIAMKTADGFKSAIGSKDGK